MPIFTPLHARRLHGLVFGGQHIVGKSGRSGRACWWAFTLILTLESMSTGLTGA